MTQFNTELAERVIGQIEAHPEEWDQRYWRVRRDCGTTFCFAGWAIQLTANDLGLSYGDVLAANGGSDMFTAQALLGLTSEQSTELFIDSIDVGHRPGGLLNSTELLDHVKGLVKKYANGES